MYNVLENFLANPYADTFEQIRHNSYLLCRVFRENKDLAVEFFGCDEWRLILKEIDDLDSGELNFIADLEAKYKENLSKQS
jgi:hypothetical protein